MHVPVFELKTSFHGFLKFCA